MCNPLSWVDASLGFLVLSLTHHLLTMANTTSAAPPGVINPSTPFAYLAPEDAVLMLTTICVNVGCLAVVLWDILGHSLADFQVIFFRRFNWKTIIYLVARISPFCFYLSGSIFGTSAKVSCGPLHDAWIVFGILSRSSTALLLYFRACAVYNHNHFVTSLFAVSWGVVVAFVVLAVAGTSGVTIGPTPYCWHMPTQYAVGSIFAEVFNDTLVCLAVMYKLTGITWTERSASIKRIFKPEQPLLTHIFMQDSLLYYVLAIVANLGTAILYFAMVHSQPTFVRVIATKSPGSLVTNLIALQIHRNMKLGTPGLMTPATSKASVLVTTSTIVFKSPEEEFQTVQDRPLALDSVPSLSYTGSSFTESSEHP
ncbi:hypothetical protein CPB83DRAFT_850351 [Crepidotus variabilis]|uniref:Uncharacterized protein n=1 Tax=Crepidotus variabilis TaxID=179855 RepID=A0A9P6JRH7_9AGAR|nr:hypothetical protein CPB83DRAFT_850351 [Crepidotus variabilis]